jgi:hypothetical protein
LSSGKYLDNVNAVVKGEHALCLGFDNNSLLVAVRDNDISEDIYPRYGENGELGIRFTAFIIPRHAKSLRWS